MPQIRLLPPVLTSVTSLASGTAGLAWTGMPGATSYNVYSGFAPGEQSDTPIASFTGTSGAIQDLLLETNYYFKVSAVYFPLGESPLSNELGYFSPGTAPGGTLTHVDAGPLNAGFGPYTLSHDYIDGTVTACLNGTEQLQANWSITGNQITFSGLDMTDYTNWSVRGNY